jgi:HEAT repeat protein
MMMPNFGARTGIVAFCFAVTLQGQVSSQQFLSQDPIVQQSAFRGFAALPEQQRIAYIPVLVALLHQTPSRRIILAFAKVGPSAVPALVKLLDDPDARVRGIAAEAIAVIRPVEPENLRRLRLLLRDTNVQVQRCTAASILSLGIVDEEAQSIIREMEKAGVDVTRARKPPGNIPDWIPLLVSDDPSIAAAAEYSLINAGQSAVPALINALKNPDSDLRAHAAEALWWKHLFGPDIEAACIQALNDPSVKVREKAQQILFWQVSEAAMDALLQYEIDEPARKRETEQLARIDPSRPRSRESVLATIPADPDHRYPLEVLDQFETTAPDGMQLFTVLHRGTARGDLLRIWNVRGRNHFLIKEQKGADFGVQLSAGAFRYQGKEYLHIMELSAGTGYEHTDEIFRIESGGLHSIAMPDGLPPVVAPNEGVWKGLGQDFEDDSLTFEFGIYNVGDANCCPSAGWARGTYTIVGDEMRYATWSRSKDMPQ